MVVDHCGILKVGPALTYAMREALFALADIETQTLGGRSGVLCSNLPAVMDRLMVADPRFWRFYYGGSEAALVRLRRQAYSDRIRYYWSRPEAVAAVQRLIANLREYPPPVSLIREHLPETGAKIRDGRLVNDPESILGDRIGEVTSIYARACRPLAS
jgi:D-tagatose-1,6-bisphosphate aldolase subunit GatZ/KbaZ